MYTDQFSFNIEREIVKDFSLSATYIYKHSANIFVNVPINEVTGEEWEYERVPFDPEFGDPVDLYSIVWQDYTGDGMIDGNDVVWIGTHGDYRVENMSSYSYTEDGDLIKPQRTYQALQLVFNKRYSAALAGTGLGGLFLVERVGPAHHAPERQHDGPDDHRRHLDGHGQLHHQQHGRRPAVRAQMGGQGFGFVHRPRSSTPTSASASGSTRAGRSGDSRTTRSTRSGAIPRARSSPAAARAASSPAPRRYYLPSLALFDLRAEKAITIRKYGSFHIVLDVFNIFNSSNVTNVEYAGLWGRITGISDARRFRLSFMYQF